MAARICILYWNSAPGKIRILKKVTWPADMGLYLSKAIENAQKLNHFHEGNQTPLFSTESNPSTQVFKLAAVLPVP
jgi:hypothetical protein